jgi:hypothetical protein
VVLPGGLRPCFTGRGRDVAPRAESSPGTTPLLHRARQRRRARADRVLLGTTPLLHRVGQRRPAAGGVLPSTLRLYLTARGKDLAPRAEHSRALCLYFTSRARDAAAAAGVLPATTSLLQRMGQRRSTAGGVLPSATSLLHGAGQRRSATAGVVPANWVPASPDGAEAWRRRCSPAGALCLCFTARGQRRSTAGCTAAGATSLLLRVGGENMAPRGALLPGLRLCSSGWGRDVAPRGAVLGLCSTTRGKDAAPHEEYCRALRLCSTTRANDVAPQEEGRVPPGGVGAGPDGVPRRSRGATA